jgi:hypothetical protein
MENEEAAMQRQISSFPPKQRPWSASSSRLRPKGFNVGDLLTVEEGRGYASKGGQGRGPRTALVVKVFQHHQRSAVNGDGRHYTLRPAVVDSGGAGGIICTSRTLQTGVRSSALTLLYSAAQCASQNAASAVRWLAAGGAIAMAEGVLKELALRKVAATMHCTHYALYSLCTVLTMHCTHYTLYSLYTVLTIHCTHYTLYSLYTVLTMHSLYTVLTIHCTHYTLYSL